MDPLSVAASVAGLLSLTIQVSGMLYEQVHTFKNAPKDATELLDELEALCQVLKSLEKFLALQSSKGCSFKETSILVNAIQKCKTQITTVKLRLEKFVGKQGLAQMVERGQWYYKHDEHQAVIQTLHRYLGMFHMSLTFDGLILVSKSIDDAARDAAQEASAKTKQLNDIAQLLSPLESISKNVSDVTNTVNHWTSKWLDEESREILAWLSPLNFWEKQDDIRARREEGTGQWIFEEATFKNWLSGTENILWCPGMPGAGKTILASKVIDHLQHSFPEDEFSIAFIYCNYKEKGEQTLGNLMSSLLQQILQKRHTLPIKVRDLYEEHTNKRTRPTLTECLELLNEELTNCSKAFVIVDALDECDESNGTRDRLIAQLLKFPMSTYLMVTSRHVPIIESQLDYSCRLEIRASDADMRVYLERQVQRETKLKHHIQADPSLMLLILERVVNAARGMFLLAELHVKAIAQKHTRRDIRKALDNLPKKINETYNEAMTRIRSQNSDDIELAHSVLTWISFALRPLTVLEMRHAIAIQSDQSDQILVEQDDLVDEETLLSVCAGLVVVDQESKVIRLIHYTAQEYFDRNRQTEFPDGQTYITKSCLKYLSFEPFQSGYCKNDDELKYRLRKNPLFRYAAQNWGNHAQGGVEIIIQIQILDFLARESELSSMVQAMQLPKFRFENYSQRYTKVVSELWVAARFDLVATVSKLLAMGIDLNTLTEQGETALYIAASRGNEGVVQLLLDQDADTDIKDNTGWTALYSAASEGHEGVVRLLLDKDADVEAKDNDGQTALYVAALGGHDGVVRLLLVKGVDAEAKDNNGRTALHMAALKGYKGVVRLLINKGADVKAKDNTGWTALYRAALRGHDGVVQLLLDKDADIEAKNDDGRTALYVAALGGHDGVVQLLLDKGADTEAKDNNGRTALYMTALRGHDGVVQLLLNKGADVEVKDNDGETALHMAAVVGYGDIVQLLLDKSTDVEAKDYKGWTALHMAAFGGHDGVVQLLLDKGADVKARYNNGRTALHIAALRGHDGVVQLLLDKGADVEVKDNKGNTVLDRSGSVRVEQLLRNYGFDVKVKDIK